MPIILFLLFALFTPCSAGDIGTVPLPFGDLSSWHEKGFKGHTDYRVIHDEGKEALHAVAKEGAPPDCIARYRSIPVQSRL